jgi:hypothetical protein
MERYSEEKNEAVVTCGKARELSRDWYRHMRQYSLPLTVRMTGAEINNPDCMKQDESFINCSWCDFFKVRYTRGLSREPDQFLRYFLYGTMRIVFALNREHTNKYGRNWLRRMLPKQV